MKTKSLTIIISLIMSITFIFPFGVTADDAAEELVKNGITYTVKDGSAVVTHGDKQAVNVEIPKTVEGYKVTGIEQDAFSCCGELENITLPEGMTYIGISAFFECKKLSDIKLPDTISTIDCNAFYGCISLKSVNLPKSLKEFLSYAFCHCTALADIKFNSNFTQVGHGIFDDTAWYEKQNDGYIYIRNVLFGYKGDMPENEVLEIPKSITCIAECALEDQPNLKNVVFNDNLEYIGWGAFQRTGIEELELPAVSAIESSTFYNCSKLRSVTIPSKVETIGHGAFENCPLLSEVKIQDGSLDYIGDAAFLDCTGLEKIYIPKNVTTIRSYSLGYYGERWGDADMVQLKPTDLTISGYAGTAAEEYAKENGFEFIPITDKTKPPKEDFVYELNDDGTATITEYLGSDDEITFPSEIDGYKVTAIGNQIFATSDEAYFEDNDKYCKIKGITIENGITTIKNRAFYNCRDLSYVNLPDTLEEVEYDVFFGCTSLTDITIPKNVDIVFSSIGRTMNFDTYDPNSDLHDSKSVSDNMIIRGYNNSSASSYANLYGFKFIALDEEIPTEETTSSDTSEPTQPDEPSKPTLKGDADMNGFVELADLTTVSKYLLSPSAFPLKNAAAKANADMNGDGLINIVDLSELIEGQLGK